MDRIRRECALAVRRLLRARGFTTIAVLLVALGVGANAAVFSVVDPLLLRKLPVSKPDQLVLLHSAGTLQTIDISTRAAFYRYTQERDIFESVVADVGIVTRQAAYKGRSSEALVNLVSSDYFDVLGVSPSTGRLFSKLDGVAPVVVLSYSYWMRAFGGDSSVIGGSLVLDKVPHTIVGITPTAFVGLRVGSLPDVYVSFASEQKQPEWVYVVGRLRPAIDTTQAEQHLQSTFQEITSASPVPDVERQQGMSKLLVTSIARGLPGIDARFRAPSLILAGVVAIILMIAIANLTTLFWARCRAKRPEIAVRRSLGATASDIAWQFVAEGILTSAVGAAIGLVLGDWISSVLVNQLGAVPNGVVLHATGGIRLFVFATALTSVAVIATGVVPAMVGLKHDMTSALKAATSGHQLGRRIGGLYTLLVVTQIAGSVILLSGTAILVRSLIELYRFDVGFQPERVLSLRIVNAGGSVTIAESNILVNRLLGDLETLPDVGAVAFAGVRPFTENEIGLNVVAETGRQPSVPVHTLMNSVSSRYFDTLGIPIVAGRACSARNTSPQEVVLSQRLAKQLFSETHTFPLAISSREGNRPFAVVGVAADAVYGSVREASPNLLYLCRQAGGYFLLSNILVRSAGASADGLAPTVGRVIQAVLPGAEVVDSRTLGSHLRESFGVDRLLTGLFVGFSILAMIIAAAGLYGVLTLIVTRQTREIGVRAAVGAGRSHIVRMVVVPALKLAGFGLLIGTIGVYGMESLLRGLIFKFDGIDGGTLLFTIVVLTTTVALASLAPVLRALRVNPSAVLRAE